MIVLNNSNTVSIVARSKNSGLLCGVLEKVFKRTSNNAVIGSDRIIINGNPDCAVNRDHLIDASMGTTKKSSSNKIVIARNEIIKRGALFVFSEEILCAIVKMQKSNDPHWKRYQESRKSNEKTDKRNNFPEVLKH